MGHLRIHCPLKVVAAMPEEELNWNTEVLNKVLIMSNGVLLSSSQLDKEQMGIINKLSEEIDCFRTDKDVEMIRQVGEGLKY